MGYRGRPHRLPRCPRDLLGFSIGVGESDVDILEIDHHPFGMPVHRGPLPGAVLHHGGGTAPERNWLR